MAARTVPANALAVLVRGPGEVSLSTASGPVALREDVAFRTPAADAPGQDPDDLTRLFRGPAELAPGDYSVRIKHGCRLASPAETSFTLAVGEAAPRPTTLGVVERVEQGDTTGRGDQPYGLPVVVLRPDPSLLPYLALIKVVAATPGLALPGRPEEGISYGLGTRAEGEHPGTLASDGTLRIRALSTCGEGQRIRLTTTILGDAASLPPVDVTADVTCFTGPGLVEDEATGVEKGAGAAGSPSAGGCSASPHPKAASGGATALLALLGAVARRRRRASDR